MDNKVIAKLQKEIDKQQAKKAGLVQRRDELNLQIKECDDAIKGCNEQIEAEKMKAIKDIASSHGMSVDAMLSFLSDNMGDILAERMSDNKPADADSEPENEIEE